jgi:hypothetical protein
MDDFNIGNLQESKNEWCVRLLNILTPSIYDGIRSILISARKLCIDNKEPDKYLLTFQNLLTRVPQWNPEIISNEVSRILKSSNCVYLEDLITCVHIIQLKLLTYARVGLKYKKIDLSIPKLPDFIHKVYINCARTCYQQAFLFKQNVPPLEIQKNNVQITQIIKECIIQSVRDSIPFELIVRSYLDNTNETFDEIKEESVEFVDTPRKIPDHTPKQSTEVPLINKGPPPSTELVEFKPKTLSQPIIPKEPLSVSENKHTTPLFQSIDPIDTKKTPKDLTDASMYMNSIFDHTNLHDITIDKEEDGTIQDIDPLLDCVDL